MRGVMEFCALRYDKALTNVQLYYYDMNADETIRQLTGDETAVVLPRSR